MQARSISRLSGHSYVAGVGPGSVAFQRDWLGAPLDRPVAASEEFLSRVSGRIGTRPDGVETGLGVLRTPMARSAGRVADWAITWLTPTSYVRDALIPAMHASAEEARRETPKVAMIVHVAVERPGRDPYALALESARTHLQAPHYVDMLRRSGLDIDASDPVAGARELVRSGTYMYGSACEIAERIRSAHEAGVEEVVLNTVGAYSEHGIGDALMDIDDITAALDSSVRPDPIGIAS